MSREKLQKSVSDKVDEYFAKPESTPEDKPEDKPDEAVEKAVKKDPMNTGGSKGKADDGEQPKKPKDEEDGERGRPKDPSKMSSRDSQGDAKMEYDKDVASPAKKPSHETTVAKSEKDEKEDSETREISKEDYEFLQKAKKKDKEEQLQKMQKEQIDLMKSAMVDVIKPIEERLEKSEKENSELKELVKSISNKPRSRKSIANIQAIEKGFGANEDSETPETFSKSEKIDAAEELFKKGHMRMEDVTEVEMTGTLEDPRKRALVEQQLSGKKN